MTKETLLPSTTDMFDRLSNTLLGFSPSFSDELRNACERSNSTYPPYNLIKVSPEQYKLVLAVAGFSKNDISVMLKDNDLKISGSKTNHDSETEYLYKGIATRQFTKNFVLSETAKVTNVVLKDGLLTIDVVYEIPEKQKPRYLEIDTS